MFLKVKTALALGIPNILRALGYRYGVKLGINSVRRIRGALPEADVFNSQESSNYNPLKANRQWCSNYIYFGWYEYGMMDPPEWHQNPFNHKYVTSSDEEWWKIPDFNPELGDIKTVWEASRFDWLISFSQHVARGDSTYLKRMNSWLSDWCHYNPAYKGPNWKCGQEASIRVIHLLLAALILKQHQNSNDALLEIVRTHLERIKPTISYAISQDNNHGTSEAAALYMGGSFLSSHGDISGQMYQEIGLKWLENRARNLIELDGSFSQHSINYHRVMLDTYSIAEYWRLTLGLSEFSKELYYRLDAATSWIYLMTQGQNGDVPNFGANDGARLIPLTGTDYRDYRPSVQLASVLFSRRRAFSDDGDWNLPLKWLNIDIPENCRDQPGSCFLPQGGYSILRSDDVFVLFNIPTYKFRPAQADALHVDLWVNGNNLLRDAGTYSYNADDEVTQYYGGTEGHNTIQLDGRDQMPRLGRFLFGAWLKATQVIPVNEVDDCITSGAAYTDYWGGFHHRIVSLSKHKLVVVDNVSGFRKKAVLRWRLHPADWFLDDGVVRNGQQISIRVTGDMPIVRLEVLNGWESRYYMKKTTIPVLEVEIHEPGELITVYNFGT